MNWTIRHTVIFTAIAFLSLGVFTLYVLSHRTKQLVSVDPEEIAPAIAASPPSGITPEQAQINNLISENNKLKAKVGELEGKLLQLSLANSPPKAHSPASPNVAIIQPPVPVNPKEVTKQKVELASGFVSTDTSELPSIQQGADGAYRALMPMVNKLERIMDVGYDVRSKIDTDLIKECAALARIQIDRGAHRPATYEKWVGFRDVFAQIAEGKLDLSEKKLVDEKTDADKMNNELTKILNDETKTHVKLVVNLALQEIFRLKSQDEDAKNQGK